MADEIKVTTGLRVVKSAIEVIVSNKTTTLDMTGDAFIRNAQTVGTTHEALVTGDLGTAGWALFKNLDTTNYVEIGVDVAATFYPVVKLLAGESCVFRLSTLTLYARANTASVILDSTMVEA